MTGLDARKGIPLLPGCLTKTAFGVPCGQPITPVVAGPRLVVPVTSSSYQARDSNPGSNPSLLPTSGFILAA